MTDVNNMDKMQIGVVVLMYEFVICSYVDLGTYWVYRGGGGGCPCQDISPCNAEDP